MEPKISLRVRGLAFGGWTRAEITRSIETMSNGFRLEFTDRWANQNDPWPIIEEDECSVWIGDSQVISGFVDRRSLSFGPGTHTLGVSGRDATANLIDCSASLKKWEFTKANVFKLATELCKPFGIGVKLQPGLAQPIAHDKLTLDPGETAHEIIEKACRLAGVLPISDGTGSLVLTRSPGAPRCTSTLVSGKNILSGSADFDATGRFATYKVLGQHKATDNFFAEKAANVKGTATDANVRRKQRVLIIRPEGNVTTAQATTRAEWEAKVRAARGDSVTLAVQGWTQADGTLWPINALVGVEASFIGVVGDMLITQVTYSIDDGGGTTTTLTLRRPDAFIPEPIVRKETSDWRELDGSNK